MRRRCRRERPTTASLPRPAWVRCREANGLLAQLIEERRRFPGAEHERLRAGMHAWVEEALLGLEPTGLQLPTFEEMENTKESDMVQLYEDRGLRWREEWREEGQRDLLIAQAGQRFGAAAGERLAEALDGHPTAETLSMAGNLIIACETSEEFFRSPCALGASVGAQSDFLPTRQAITVLTGSSS